MNDLNDPIGKRIQQHRKVQQLTQEQLAAKAGIPYTTLTKIESGVIKNPSVQAISKLAQALNASLDDFVMVESYRGKNALRRIFDDVLKSVQPGNDMCITGIDERLFLDADEEGIKTFITELKKRGISQKLLSCEGDSFQLEGEHLEYRWIPKRFFNPTPIYTYADKVATVVWGPPRQVVILSNPPLADAYRKQFLFMWEHAKKM